jgi:hypothetical protein
LVRIGVQNAEQRIEIIGRLIAAVRFMRSGTQLEVGVDAAFFEESLPKAAL